MENVKVSTYPTYCNNYVLNPDGYQLCLIITRVLYFSAGSEQSDMLDTDDEDMKINVEDNIENIVTVSNTIIITLNQTDEQ